MHARACALRRDDQLRFRPWHLLTSQLQYVVGEVLRFTTIDVLEPLWADMDGRIGGAASMDEASAARWRVRACMLSCGCVL